MKRPIHLFLFFFFYIHLYTFVNYLSSGNKWIVLIIMDSWILVLLKNEQKSFLLNIIYIYNIKDFCNVQCIYSWQKLLIQLFIIIKWKEEEKFYYLRRTFWEMRVLCSIIYINEREFIILLKRLSLR